MRKPILGLLPALTLTLTLAVSGCAADDSEPGTSSPPSVEPRAEPSDAPSDQPSDDQPSDDQSPDALETLEAGDPLPESLTGTFEDEREGMFVTFHEAGDDFCAAQVGTSLDCYAIRDAPEPSGEPLEMGALAVRDDALSWVPSKDPMASCIGQLNEARWAPTSTGVTIIPTRDCHGLTPYELTRLSG